MRTSIKYLVLLACIFSGHVQVISQSSVLDDLPDHGFGFLERVSNKTEFPIGIYYDKHPTHDAIPEDSVVRIKSLKSGKYYTVRKTEDKKITFKADTTNINDKATQFTTHHRISGDLHPWITLSHITVQNATMRVDPATKMVVFDAKNFIDEAATTAHWEIKGDSIDNCFLVNRETAGPISPYTGKIGITKILKEKGFETAQALWCLSYKTTDEKVNQINASFQAQINQKRQEQATIQQQINAQQGRINAITAEAAQYPVGNFLYARDGNSAPARAVYFENQEFGAKQQWRIRERGAECLSLECVWYGGYFCVHPPEGHPHGNCSCDNWSGHPSGKSCERLVWTAWRLSNYSRNAPPAGQGPYEKIKFVDMNNGEEIVKLNGLWAGRVVAIYSVHYGKFLKCYRFDQIGGRNVGLKAISNNRSEPWCQFKIHRNGDHIGIQLLNTYQHEFDNFNNLKNRVAQLDREIADLDQQRQQQINAARAGAHATIHAYRNGKWITIPGGLSTLTIRNDAEAWGCNIHGEFYHYTNNTWNKITIQESIDYVSVSAKGDVWCIDRRQQMWVKSGAGFALASREGLADNIKIIKLAVRNENEVWGLGFNNFIYKFDGSEWKKKNPADTPMLHVSAAENGAVWAIDKDGKVWQFENQKNWKTIPCEQRLKQIAVRNDKDVFAISNDRELLHWNGAKWESNGSPWDMVSVASGVTEIAAETKIEYTESEGVRTQQEDGKALTFTDDARIQFEVVKLGMGGGIPPQSAGDYVKLPVTKNPKIAGFAKDHIEDVNTSTLLNVNPLLSKGAAWLETSLPTPGKASVSFLARSNNSGDIQVVFGQNISNSYVWRIRIGGYGNTKSVIEKRRYIGNEQLDEVVYEVSRDQNPIAAASPGNLSPYWISLESGLILVGLGDFGENTFMAWRDPNPPSDVICVGFGSHKQSVQYTQIQLGQPVIAKKPLRLYLPNKTIKKTNAVAVSPSKDSFTWSPYPFRTADNGTLCFEVKGKEKVVIALGSDPQDNTNHYAVVFGDIKDPEKPTATAKSGISIKKWYKVVKTYVEKVFIGDDTYPDIALDPTTFKKFWISFLNGQIIVGQGDIGQNIITVFQDIAPFDSIDAIGFAAFGTTPAQIQNIQIAPATTLTLQKKETSYKLSKTSTAFSGAVTIILPFEYKFSQQGQSVKLDDLVNNTSFYPGATPQQGALYSFMFTVLPNGAPKMDWTTAPTNPKELKLQREITKLNASADLERVKAELDVKAAGIEREKKEAEALRVAAQGTLEKESLEARAQHEASEGSIDRDLKTAEGDKSRKEYEAQMGSSRLMTETGSMVIGHTAGAGPIGAAIGAALGGGFIASGFAYGIMAEGRLKDAAKKDFEGAQLEAQARRRATSTSELAANLELLAKQKAALASEQAALIEAQLKQKAIEREANAAQIAFNAQLLNGEAKFAFRSHDSYVYIDDPKRPELGSATIPLEAKDNQAKVLELLDRADDILADDKEKTYSLLSTCQKILYKITHFYVVNTQEIKLRIFNNLDKLFKVSSHFPQFYNDIIKVLFTAFNNSFLVNEAQPTEATRKEIWLNAITRMVREQLKTTGELVLDAFCGEYSWIPLEFSKPNKGTLTFTADGNNDLFICFASDFRKKTRNSTKDIYEIVLGGWENTRHALRIQSLGKSVKEISTENDPSLSLNPQEAEAYWISLNNGTITVGKGEVGQTILLSWTDPYPIANIKYIGFSSWDSPVNVHNIKVSEATFQAPPKAPKSKKKVRPTSLVGIGTVTVKQTQAEEEESVDAIDQEIDEKIEDEGLLTDEPDIETVPSKPKKIGKPVDRRTAEPYVTERIVDEAPFAEGIMVGAGGGE